MRPWGCVPRDLACNRAISSAAIRLYVILASYADRERICWPSIKVLAADLGITERNVQRSLAELVNAGAVERTARTNERGASTTNVLKLTGWEGVMERHPPVAEIATLPPAENDTPKRGNTSREQTTGKRTAPTSQSAGAPKPARPKRPARKQYPAEFEEVWRIYPRHKADEREGCLQHWHTAVRSDDPELIVVAAKDWAREQAQNPYHYGLRRWLKNKIYRTPAPVYRPQDDAQGGVMGNANAVLAKINKRGNGEYHDGDNEIVSGARDRLPIAVGARH